MGTRQVQIPSPVAPLSKPGKHAIGVTRYQSNLFCVLAPKSKLLTLDQRRRTHHMSLKSTVGVFLSITLLVRELP